MKIFYILLAGVLLSVTCRAHAFSNSLDGSSQQNSIMQSKLARPNTSNNFQNSPGQSYNPKEHTGFEHQDRNFPDPTMNDTRYNSNCQFGTCSPGGLNPNNKR